MTPHASPRPERSPLQRTPPPGPTARRPGRQNASPITPERRLARQSVEATGATPFMLNEGVETRAPSDVLMEMALKLLRTIEQQEGDEKEAQCWEAWKDRQGPPSPEPHIEPTGPIEYRHPPAAFRSPALQNKQAKKNSRPPSPRLGVKVDVDTLSPSERFNAVRRLCTPFSDDAEARVVDELVLHQKNGGSLDLSRRFEAIKTQARRLETLMNESQARVLEVLPAPRKPRLLDRFRAPRPQKAVLAWTERGLDAVNSRELQAQAEALIRQVTHLVHAFRKNGLDTSALKAVRQDLQTAFASGFPRDIRAMDEQA